MTVSNCRLKFAYVFFFEQELLPLNIDIYIENGSNIQFSPKTCLLKIRLQLKHIQDTWFDNLYICLLNWSNIMPLNMTTVLDFAVLGETKSIKYALRMHQ